MTEFKNGKSEPVARRPQRTLKLVYHRIEDLIPDPANARVHNKKQIRQLARSIDAFGFNIPVVVDARLKVIAGHCRIEACRQLGWPEVPTICLDHLSEEQARAFAIADNRLSELSSWDNVLLGEQLKILSAVDLDFSLDVTGFEIAEIDLLIEGTEKAADADPADVVPAVETGPPISRPGDLWILGCHRIYCGSALDDRAYHTLMGKDRAAVVFTDPPYNVPIEGHASGRGGIHHREFTMATGEMDEAEFTRFLAQVCALMAEYSRQGALHYVCMDWRHASDLQTAGKQVYTELKNLCVWTKDNAGMGSLYRSAHELVFVFKHGRGRHRNNVELGRHGRNRTNVWPYPCARSFSRSGDEGNLAALHPTVKPVQLVADALLDCSERGGIVLDAFLGSGTTLIAAERTGRLCRGIEIDPLYVDAAVRRWQVHTGDQAHHADTGLSFDATALESEGAAMTEKLGPIEADELSEIDPPPRVRLDHPAATPGDYEVGYKKPPKHTQFQPGVSGNLHGRPKTSETFGATTCRVANQKVTITENGKCRRISKFEAYVTQLANKGAAGSRLDGREFVKTMLQFGVRAQVTEEGRLTFIIEGGETRLGPTRELPRSGERGSSPLVSHERDRC